MHTVTRSTMTRLIVLCMALCCCTISAVAQPTQAVQIIARRTADGIILRWAPTSNDLFRIALRSGYRLERATVDAGGAIGAFTRVLDEIDTIRAYERPYVKGAPQGTHPW